MKKVICSALFSLTVFLCFSQMPAGMQRNGQQAQMPTGRFYGKIVDAANKGIEAVSVVLVTTKMDTATKKPKEVIVGGMLTTSTGDFSVENVPLMAKYKLKISGIGYKQVEKQVAFEMPNRNSMGNGDPSAMLGALDKDLGNLKLEVDNQVLGNVTVTASKPLLQIGVDRKVFNVEKNIVSAGGTAVDVMKNVPSVNVDIDGNVTLRNAAPQIFVDGRPTNMTLDQIPADAIESVEIITNPSAKFDASGGTAGILNIVMKKNKRVGYSGNLRTNIDSRAKVGLGVDINVRQNKINVFASANINQRKSIGEGSVSRTTLGMRPNNSLQQDKSVMEGLFGFGRIGFDYFNENLILQTDYSNPLSDKSKFELGARASIRKTTSGTGIYAVDNSFKVLDTLQRIEFNSKDKVYATYGTYTNRFKKLGYQIGLRAESSIYEGNNKGQKFNTDYPISLFPSLFLSQKINDNTDLQLNYSRRINRPGFWQLFPFVDISDSLNISHGNPALKPEFTNSIELTYSKTFKNRDNFIASVYFKNTNNLITKYLQPEYVKAYDSIMPVSTYINANKSYVTGL